MLTGRSVRVDLSPAPNGPLTTLAAVKECIGRIEGMEPDEMRLIFAGKRLEDGRTLNHYGICNGSVLHVVVRLPGKVFFPFAPLPDPATDQIATWANEVRVLTLGGSRTCRLSLFTRR
jgi:hypothetical protein